MQQDKSGQVGASRRPGDQGAAGEVATTRSETVRRGRPRDSGMDGRILDAALAVYGRVGWLGFNLDGVAREAKVSKDALYRRWRTREQLLADTLSRRWDWVAAIDTGTIRDDLLALATRAFDTFAGPYGEAALILRSDSRHFPEVRTFEEPYRESIILQGRAIVRRAIARGELPAATEPGLVMDLLVGATINHIISTPPRLRERMLGQGPAFIQRIVNVVLAGLRG